MAVSARSRFAEDVDGVSRRSVPGCLDRSVSPTDACRLPSNGRRAGHGDAGHGRADHGLVPLPRHDECVRDVAARTNTRPSTSCGRGPTKDHHLHLAASTH